MTGLRTGGVAILALLVGAPLLAGCTPTFRPLEANWATRSELATADYSLTEQDRNFGAAQVWLAEPDAGSRRVRLGLRLRNEGTSPLRIDLEDTELEVRTEDGRLLVIPEIEAFLGEQVFAPQRTSRSELVFVLPEDLTLGDLVGFELVWAVVAEDGARLTRSTPFGRETWREARARSYYGR
ncbi:MAG: hypothetical protein M9894_23245 [Planctomycetes bacterium]|nr:hypothetical protein [Planctomycetota bacterium]